MPCARVTSITLRCLACGADFHPFQGRETTSFVCSRKCFSAYQVTNLRLSGEALRRRFEKFFEKTDGCWIWKGDKQSKGYGRISINSVDTLAHRFAYELYKGPITDGLFVCHTCDNPACVNPDHLWLGTNQDNQIDCASKNRNYKLPWLGGSRHPRAVITEETAKAIKNFDGSNKDAAEKFKVSKSVVSQIRTGQTWKHA